MSTSALAQQLRSSAIMDYGVAVLSVVTTVLASLALNRLSIAGASFPLLLCAIMFVAWNNGTGAALLATVLTALAIDYFFLQPTHSFAILAKDIPQLALFATASLFVISLSMVQRRREKSLRRASDTLQATVRDLQRHNEALRIDKAQSESGRLAADGFGTTIDSIPAYVATYELDGTRSFVNKPWQEYTGLTLKEATGEEGRASIHFHPDDTERAESAWRASLANGEPLVLDVRVRGADGAYRWHRQQRVPRRNEKGDIVRWYSVGVDIDDQKRAEAAWRASESRLADAQRELQATIDTIPALVAAYEPDGARSFVNQTWRNYTGITFQGATSEGKGGFPHLHPDDLEQDTWRASLEKGQSHLIEVRIRRADGEYRWHTSERVPLRDENGNIVKWYSVGVDIEDKKRAEDALRWSEAQLAEAQRELQLTINSIPALVVTHQRDGARNFVNQTWKTYTGLTLQQAMDERGRTAFYHPDDVERAEAAWQDSLGSGAPLLMEVRLRNADGDYRWHTIRRVPLRDEAGNIIKWHSVGFDIEDQKVAEGALRRSEAQLANAERELRLTLDSIPTLAWRARSDGCVEYFNKRWLDYTGLSLQQALGWDWQEAIHPEDLSALHKTWREMLASEKPAEVEARMRCFDGTYRWFLFRPEPLRDETGSVVRWYGTNTDIEDRKRAESAFQRSEAYSAEAQRLSATGSFAWKNVGEEHFWSDQTYEIFGFARNVRPSLELVRQRIHPDDRQSFEREVNRAEKKASKHDYELRLLMPDGHIKHLHIVAHPVTYGQGIEEIVGALMDVTEAKKSQEALHAAQSALAHASRVATLGEISATIAHEVNQPLAAIVANGQACLRFLRRETPNLEDVRGTVECIVHDGNRAGEIIQRVRGLLKKADPQKAPLDVNEAIEEVVALLQRELAAQSAILRMERAPDIPLTVADKIQLQQVIINLVMNGIEAMHAVTGRPRTLVIQSYRDEAHQVVVAVKDCGSGIPAETAARIFDAFYSTKPSGLGIGLSICRSIIENHGGRLWATDNGGEPGATFQFALPPSRENVM